MFSVCTTGVLDLREWEVFRPVVWGNEDEGLAVICTSRQCNHAQHRQSMVEVKKTKRTMEKLTLISSNESDQAK